LEKVVLCEIDGGVIAAAKEYLPEISCGLSHPKAQIIVDDGIKHVRNHKSTYDVIVVDAPDPVGPAAGLFSADFYRDIYESLKDDGIFVAQTESPFFFEDLIKQIYKDVSSIFPISRLFLANVPSYPGGFWTFTLGSKKHDPLLVEKNKILPLDTKFYSPAIHKSCFVLPPFVKKMIGL
jgi:spermidine synthase